MILVSIRKCFLLLNERVTKISIRDGVSIRKPLLATVRLCSLPESGQAGQSSDLQSAIGEGAPERGSAVVGRAWLDLRMWFALWGLMKAR